MFKKAMTLKLTAAQVKILKPRALKRDLSYLTSTVGKFKEIWENGVFIHEVYHVKRCETVIFLWY